MPAEDLYKLILQNINRLDPDDARFELNQLFKITKINFNKEIEELKDPDVVGKPKVLKKIRQQITHQFKAYQKN